MLLYVTLSSQRQCKLYSHRWFWWELYLFMHAHICILHLCFIPSTIYTICIVIYFGNCMGGTCVFVCVSVWKDIRLHPRACCLLRERFDRIGNVQLSWEEREATEEITTEKMRKGGKRESRQVCWDSFTETGYRKNKVDVGKDRTGRRMRRSQRIRTDCQN